MLKTFLVSKLGMAGKFSYGLILGIQRGIFLIGMVSELFMMLVEILVLSYLPLLGMMNSIGQVLIRTTL
jgi:hypothetical protein